MKVGKKGINPPELKRRVNENIRPISSWANLVELLHKGFKGSDCCCPDSQNLLYRVDSGCGGIRYLEFLGMHSMFGDNIGFDRLECPSSYMQGNEFVWQSVEHCRREM